MSELLTVRDVATVLKCGEDAVVRRFAKMPGVIDLGNPRPEVVGAIASCESRRALSSNT